MCIVIWSSNEKNVTREFINNFQNNDILSERRISENCSSVNKYIAFVDRIGSSNTNTNQGLEEKKSYKKRLKEYGLHNIDENLDIYEVYAAISLKNGNVSLQFDDSKTKEQFICEYSKKIY